MEEKLGAAQRKRPRDPQGCSGEWGLEIGESSARREQGRKEGEAFVS